MIGMKLRAYTKTTGTQIFSFGCAVMLVFWMWSEDGAVQLDDRHEAARVHEDHRDANFLFRVRGHAGVLDVVGPLLGPSEGTVESPFVRIARRMVQRAGVATACRRLAAPLAARCRSSCCQHLALRPTSQGCFT